MLLAVLMVLGTVAMASAASDATMTMDCETTGKQVTVTVAVTKGTTATTFSPEDKITRQELVTMLYRYAQYKGDNVAASKDLSQFADADQIAPWAEPTMS